MIQMIKLSFLNLFRRKSRTFLSVLGMAIGVGAIIGLVSVVGGVFNEYNSIIGGMQGVWVWEKDVIDQTLSKIDASLAGKISSVTGVRTVVPEIWVAPSALDGKPVGLTSGSQSMTAVYGVDLSKYGRLRSNAWIGELGKGSMLKPGESGYVVIGKTLADDHDKFIGSSIKVNGKRFKVKGILKSESEMLGGIIFMSIQDAREISGFPSSKVSSFFVELFDPSQDSVVAEKLGFVLGPDVDVMTTSDLSGIMSDTLGSFNIVVFLVGGLAAFVAGIGIINTILMSVLERTREIGALMATGWTGLDIMKMIIYESLFIGVIGGIAGILLGLLLSESVKAYGLPSVVTQDVVIESFVFAVVLGLLAGIYPAYRASRLDPIEAIRGA